MNETEKDNTLKDLRTSVLAKIQKLTAALYLVSDFMANSEPLKWKLRDKALEVLSQSNASALFDGAYQTIGQMVSLIEVALTMPGLSQMNFSLLKKEYESLQEKMLGTKDELWQSLPALTTKPIPLGTKTHGGLSSESGVSNGLRSKPVNNSRRETILKFITEHGWSSIKDIAQKMPEVSAKTVQRELAEMVQLGLLKKEGDRRWSRYEVAGRTA